MINFECFLIVNLNGRFVLINRSYYEILFMFFGIENLVLIFEFQ